MQGNSEMIISEKQIMQLIILFRFAIDGSLTASGEEEANALLETIENQQSEELEAVE